MTEILLPEEPSEQISWMELKKAGESYLFCPGRFTCDIYSIGSFNMYKLQNHSSMDVMGILKIEICFQEFSQV